jgi:XTP/dITP diphosphohydrolase
MKILAATGNKHKIKEFQSILTPLGIDFIAPNEVGGIPDTEETGNSFEANASLKALDAAKATNMYSFADDSGLEIEALNNAPGIFSSRYANTDEQRISRVLNELKHIQTTSGICNRNARFVCVIAFSTPDKILKLFRGEVYGTIADAPSGKEGFGYDPIFIPNGYKKSFAQLSPNEKDKISHRANALVKAKSFFQQELHKLK